MDTERKPEAAPAPGNVIEVAPNASALRAIVARWREAGDRVALVPTMGALHAGHLALVDRARDAADRVVVSIFVNPTQFAPTEDLDRYPRTIAADRMLLTAAGADLVYAPSASDMYPEGFGTRVTPGGAAEAGLEDAARPHFFGGVATVVAKLLLQCGPDVATFGEKDYQQLVVVTAMVRDFDLPVTILPVPTVREPDGLALSSRNRFLTADERRRAVAMAMALETTATALRAGTAAEAALAGGRDILRSAGFALDYLEARNAHTLAPLGPDPEPIRLLAAGRLGTVRLIDNIGV